ncbi:MAG: adenylate/guanylate cyclase domain-containing protein [Gallionella sp.]|nr:adenylate/guanylate cyclase domain-containing protein [Gallionella sp.]
MQDDPEKYPKEQEKFDSQFEKKFTKFITVMLTGIKGTPTTAEKEGGMASCPSIPPRGGCPELVEGLRTDMLIKTQSDILLPAIKEHHGNFIKSSGDGSVAYFDNALDAVRAAARIQKDMDDLNMSKKIKFPVLMRIGLHSGKCAVEEQDICGDVVEAASSFEAAADGGGILMSEGTYNALSDKSEIYCRFVKQVVLKGNKEPCNAYKAFWNPREIELDKPGKAALQPQAANIPANSSGLKLVWGVAVLIGLVLLLSLGSRIFGSSQAHENSRSINEFVSSPGTPDSQR